MTNSLRTTRRAVAAAILPLALLMFFVAGSANAALGRTSAVVPASAATIKRAIASHRGHVVVVNFWATWCIPCEAEFPAIVALHREYAHSGLVVITVSADMLRDRHTKVDPFLASQHAYFANFLQHSADPEDFINAFDRNWQGDLPRTFVYDRHGTLCAELANGQTLKSLETAVRPLL